MIKNCNISDIWTKKKTNIHRDERQKLLRKPNTDGIINKTCHGFCFCSCYQDKSVIVCTATAPGLISIILHLDKYFITYKPYTATLPELKKLCTMTAKTRAILSLHRDYFPAKVPGPCPDASSSNTY